MVVNVFSRLHHVNKISLFFEPSHSLVLPRILLSSFIIIVTFVCIYIFRDSSIDLRLQYISRGIIVDNRSYNRGCYLYGETQHPIALWSSDRSKDDRELLQNANKAILTLFIKLYSVFSTIRIQFGGTKRDINLELHWTSVLPSPCVCSYLKLKTRKQQVHPPNQMVGRTSNGWKYFIRSQESIHLIMWWPRRGQRFTSDSKSNRENLATSSLLPLCDVHKCEHVARSSEAEYTKKGNIIA